MQCVRTAGINLKSLEISFNPTFRQTLLTLGGLIRLHLQLMMHIWKTMNKTKLLKPFVTHPVIGPSFCPVMLTGYE